MLVPVRNLGQLGVIMDTPPQDLPTNAASMGNNVLFRDGAARKVNGNTLIAYVMAGGDAAWFETWQYIAGTYKQAVGFDDGTIFVWNGAVWSAPVIQDQAGVTVLLSASGTWQSTVFGKFCVLNNKSDIPVYSWNSETSSADGSKFKMIPGWGAANSPSGSVKSVRAHRNFLIAVGVENSPYTVYWSDAAAINSFPSSWDYASTTNLAGYLQISASDGPLIDCCEMGDMMIVYTQTATYALQYVGGSDVFSLRRLLPYGLINRECATQFAGRNFCIGDNMIYVHDGINVERVAKGKVESEFFGSISQNSKVLCTSIADRKEVWIYYSTGSAESANRALVWNWEENTWSFIDLLGISCIAPSVVIEASPTIGSLTGTIGSYSGTIGEWERTGANRVLIATAGTGAVVSTGLYRLNYGNRSVNANYYAYVERTGLDLDEIKQNAARSMHVRSIIPQIRGSGTVDFQIGGQRSAGDDVDWGDIKTFDLDNGAEYKVDIRKTGRYLAYRVGVWQGAARLNSWELTGMDIDMVDGGR